MQTKIAELVGSTWTDIHGVNPRAKAERLHGGDMVVAPCNDQVALLRDVLDRRGVTRDVRVGTVDKFPGQEAPIVFFTMTTSDSHCMPRGTDFLFSKNRTSVAISRARCLAYLVCTDELLNSRARDIEEMKLIATLCSFVNTALTMSDCTCGAPCV